MTTGLHTSIRQYLQNLYPPQGSVAAEKGKGLDIVRLGLVSDIFTADGKAFFSITIPAAEAPLWENLRRQAEEEAVKTATIERAFVSLTAEKPASTKTTHAPARPLPLQSAKSAAKQPLTGVKHIIAVASGKGGVGKSTMAVNIAAAFVQQGLKTGLLDADIYGPSLPKLTGISKPQGKDIIEFHEKKLVPLERYGLKLMSMGFLADEKTPLVWRGPMVMSAVRQLLYDVLWAPLDILVVDLPPGTGDAQLSLAQKVPVSGAVIVSTPQELALIDVRKAIEMFNKIHVPILGIIENMSYFIAPDTKQHYAVFGGIDKNGKGGAEREALKRKVPFLGALPLDPHLSTAADSGIPLPLAEKSSPLAEAYRHIADKLARQLHLIA